MRDHLRKAHGARAGSKRFRAADFVVEAVYHACRVCGEAVLQVGSGFGQIIPEQQQH